MQYYLAVYNFQLPAMFQNGTKLVFSFDELAMVPRCRGMTWNVTPRHEPKVIAC